LSHPNTELTSKKKRLKTLRDELGFDPCKQAKALTAAAHGALKDAKRVVKALTVGDPERESACLETSWEILRDRGKATCLADFLAHVKDRMVPLIPGEPPVPQ
jgi:hypothetical protein